MPQRSAIPQRPFGRHCEVKIVALGLGGHHIGRAQDEATGLSSPSMRPLRVFAKWAPGDPFLKLTP
ncbi:MAG: hypothetical protein ABSF22_06625 [Bryobacteraceae bacterium]